MVSYLLLACVGLVLAYAFNTYRSFARNVAAAKRSGIPYSRLPVHNFNIFWLMTCEFLLPWLRKLPSSWTEEWIDFIHPEMTWTTKYDMFKKHNSDVVLLVSPGGIQCHVADPDAISQITTRRNDFPKPVWMYMGLDIYGKNVVTTEGANWRHHRKITSPPFTEKNNVLVWQESLRQAQSMVEGWVSKNAVSSAPVWNVAACCMKLSLFVIARAGFGKQLYWEHQKKDDSVPPGHTMTFTHALETLLENLLYMILVPRWFLKNSPMASHKLTWTAYTEWGQYMREMYEEKRAEVQRGENKEGGMDLMGAIVKGAGFTEAFPNADGKGEKKASQLLTNEEIMGNAFVFVVAGHETAANTINFSILFLAMHIQSQRRLQEDLDSIFGEKPASEWDFDKDVPQLFGGMCGAVMNEELRMIPPAIGVPKSTPKDQPQGLTFKGKSVMVPGGAHININVAAVHRNPSYWPTTSEKDLDEFRPERWILDPSKQNSNTDENAYEEEAGLEFDGPDKRPDTVASLYRPYRSSYVPFSEGYRSCLGRRFAQVEILAVLAVIFKHYSVELDVSEYLSDDDFATASEAQKKEAWQKADARARHLLDHGMGTIITIQMRKGKVPLRFVKRGHERFKS